MEEIDIEEFQAEVVDPANGNLFRKTTNDLYTEVEDDE